VPGVGGVKSRNKNQKSGIQLVSRCLLLARFILDYAFLQALLKTVREERSDEAISSIGRDSNLVRIIFKPPGLLKLEAL